MYARNMQSVAESNQIYSYQEAALAMKINYKELLIGTTEVRLGCI